MELNFMYVYFHKNLITNKEKFMDNEFKNIRYHFVLQMSNKTKKIIIVPLKEKLKEKNKSKKLNEFIINSKI